jgi:hypothetical protein
MRNRKTSNGKSQRSNRVAKKSKRTKRTSGHTRRPSEGLNGVRAENNRPENA